jgi:hypothetical protein
MSSRLACAARAARPSGISDLKGCGSGRDGQQRGSDQDRHSRRFAQESIRAPLPPRDRDCCRSLCRTHGRDVRGRTGCHRSRGRSPSFRERIDQGDPRPGADRRMFNRTLIGGVSRESKGEQVAWSSSSLVEEFSFVTPTERTSAPPPVKPPPATLDPEADARAAYQCAERIGTISRWAGTARPSPIMTQSVGGATRLGVPSPRHLQRRLHVEFL